MPGGVVKWGGLFLVLGSGFPRSPVSIDVKLLQETIVIGCCKWQKQEDTCGIVLNKDEKWRENLVRTHVAVLK